jgi:hypothetical protein
VPARDGLWRQWKSPLRRDFSEDGNITSASAMNPTQDDLAETVTCRFLSLFLAPACWAPIFFPTIWISMMSSDRHTVRRWASFRLAGDLKSCADQKTTPESLPPHSSPRNEFGMSLASAKEYETRRRVTEGWVVSEMVDSSGVRYAVIAGLRTETSLERLVIAYTNEKSLRNLIAARSIIALGFSSHEEAAAGRNSSMRPAAASYEQMRETIGVWSEKCLQVFKWADRRTEIASALRRAAGFLVSSYSGVSTKALVIVSSTNAVSAVVRMALGSSV